jgi:hypothetical protein
MPRPFNSLSIQPIPIDPAAWMVRIMGSMFAAKRLASARSARLPISPASAMLVGLPNVAPRALLAARAARVRSEIRRRSFSAMAA